MQRIVNLVDLKNPEKMRLLSLSELSIQKRTSLLKFGGQIFIISIDSLVANARGRGAFWQSFDGPFSAVSTPPIARVGAFFQDFRDLQDLHAFAPLRIQNFNKISFFFFSFFPKKILLFFLEFAIFRANFDENFSEFHEIS